MELANLVDATSPRVQSDTSLVLFQPQLTFDPKDVRSLIGDFFAWLEFEWRLPVFRNFIAVGSDLLSQSPIRDLFDAQKTYTAEDLASLWGYSLTKVQTDVRHNKIHPVGMLTKKGKHFGTNYNLYSGQDLLPVVEKWEWTRLRNVIDLFWGRFLKEACGECPHCLHHLDTIGFNCLRDRRSSIKKYRASFFAFLEAIQQYRDIGSWWDAEKEAIFVRERRAISRDSGIVLLYLLDKHLLKVSVDEFLRIPFKDIEYKDIVQLWRNRRHNEYETLVYSLKKAGYAASTQKECLALLATLVLLRNGIPGVAELKRRLTSEESQQAIVEERLVTRHIAHGVFLGFPMSDDIRVGHVFLDEIRLCFWNYAAAIMPKRNKSGYRRRWNHGPRVWKQVHVQAIERALTLRVWGNEQSIITPRPETEKVQANPHALRLRDEQTGYAVSLLPEHLRKTIQTFVDYRYAQRKIALSTIAQDLEKILSFLCWMRKHTELREYIYWDQNTTCTTVSAFLTERYSDCSGVTQHSVITKIHVFFDALAEMCLPHPEGYDALLKLRQRKDCMRSIPPEEVLDRVFHDGVCQLDYDPFARLALTIQYYCGTRVTETCELSLFCVLDDPNTGLAYLLIPLGKPKQERRFPIASVGMGPFLEYMQQVFEMQVFPSSDELSYGLPRNLPRMNVRYLETEPEKAYEWNYLFDRVSYTAEHGQKRQRVLNPTRVRDALKEAMLLAARRNPRGLFQEGTYSRQCRRRKGQECGYYAFRDGVTTCPVCGGKLPGTRGSRCQRLVEESIACQGVAEEGEYFCPECEAPLADLVTITPHTFRHNSVTRAHRAGVSPEQNMRLHGHQTLPMYIRYLHLVPQDLQEAVCSIFSEKLLRQLGLEINYSPGQIIEEGVAQTATVKRVLEVTLYRGQKRRTTGVWGAFWAGALADQGVLSPTQLQAEMLITKETYHFAVAQYRYEALGLAVSEVALERGTKRKFKAEVPPFLERQEIEMLVAAYLENVQQGYLSTRQGVRLLEADILKQRTFLNELAAILRPWWEHIGSIDRYVTALFPDIDNFSKREA